MRHTAYSKRLYYIKINVGRGVQIIACDGSIYQAAVIVSRLKSALSRLLQTRDKKTSY